MRILHSQTAPAIAIALLCAGCAKSPARAPVGDRPQVVRIWPGQAPGTENWTGPEQQVDADLPNVGKVHIVTNVTVPTLTVFRPADGTGNGTAMLVVPGGSFRALPWDLDGLETARWLTARGITAFVLKYRVRPPDAAPGAESFEQFAARTAPARAIAVADGERALVFVRGHAQAFAIDPKRVGMIGFSAGAMTVMAMALKSDPADRPDFAVSMYGALPDQGMPAAGAPPLFIVAAQDDRQAPPAGSAEIFKRWSDAGLPAELHIYEKGGHGFAFRTQHLPVDRWPAALEAWLASRGYLAAPTSK